MACIRCGREDHIERHHIIEQLAGGDDDPENLEDRCRDCHLFEHMRRGIMRSLEYERRRGQQDRIRVYEHRVEVLEALNTPELVRGRGTYVSYWTDSSTHRLPRRIPTRKEAELDSRIQASMDEFIRQQSV